ncbi:MAG: Trm112 family protein [Thermoprotei archaeon]|nr:MAG: Trm112 family protein [Thermoprotei archaeon]RLE81551.1 MAG: Trm112 family protein [Thermoprotei archaeon]RLF01634.1 MAG: Trm112 family protein [Thermoprotei archaeon]
MKYRLMDLLACPYCKKFPLELYVLEENEYPERKLTLEKPVCELYCGLLRKHLKEMSESPPCDECIKKEVSYAAIYCSECGRWYPVRDEIPILLPDEYRQKKDDIEFLRKYRERLPEKIVIEGKPFNLSEG